VTLVRYCAADGLAPPPEVPTLRTRSHPSTDRSPVSPTAGAAGAAARSLPVAPEAGVPVVGTPSSLRRATLVAVIAAALVGAAIPAYGLSIPNALLGLHDYDDGVYFGASLRLLGGALPYRDFVLLHPPGIALLLAPCAALAHAIGTREALAVARCLTVLVAGLNCALVALAVRHRGPLASLTAGLALACFPVAVAGDQTVLLEPYLAAACLAGTVLAFRDGELATGRRAIWAGVLFGVAASIKVWAVLPIAALALVCIGRRSSATRLGAGLLAGVAVPCLPFFLLAPSAFVHEVLVVQLTRGGGAAPYGLVHRLGDLTSLAGWAGLVPSSALVVGVSVGLVVVVAACYAAIGSRLRRADLFVLVTAALLVVAVLTSREFYEYYAYIPAVFVAAVLGVCAGGGLELAGSLVERARRTAPGAGHVLRSTAELRLVASLAVAVAAACLIPVDVGATHAYIAASGLADPGPVVDAAVPRGACALSDEGVVLVIADRYSSARPGCPVIVDTFGTWLSADPAQPPPSAGVVVPQLAASWRHWLGTARWLVLSVPMSDYIPWTPALTAWFEAHYRQVANGPKAWVYERKA
jgi:hypothetical protein